MTRATTRLTHEFVETFPRPMRRGVIYVSTRFAVAGHLCCCACGNEVITPLSPAGWTLRYDGEVSLSPSIGNGSLPCRSHYWIDHNAVRWARTLTDEQHTRAKHTDARDLDRWLSPEAPTGHRSGQRHPQARHGGLYRAWQLLRHGRHPGAS